MTYCRLARHLGTQVILPVVITREDTDTETLDLVLMELGEMVVDNDHGVLEPAVFSGDNVTSVLETIETQVAERSLPAHRDKDSPLLMALEQVSCLLIGQQYVEVDIAISDWSIQS